MAESSPKDKKSLAFDDGEYLRHYDEGDDFDLYGPSFCRALFNGRPFSTRESEVGELDVPRTFCPEPWYGSLALKMFFGVIILAFVVYAPVLYTSAIWTDYALWADLTSVLYFFCSALCCVSSIEQPKDYTPSLIVRVTWFLAVLAYPSQVLSTISYWWLGLGSSEHFMDMLARGGGLALLVVTDVVLVNNVPLRLVHFWFQEIWMVLFIFFCVNYWKHHADEEDDENEDPEGTTPLIVSERWSSLSTAGVVKVALLTLFVAVPLNFMLCWVVSVMAPSCCGGFNATRRRMYHSSRKPTSTMSVATV